MLWGAGSALVSAVALTGADVALRAFGRPLTGVYELVGILGALAVGLALPQTSLSKGHVRMDFLTDRLPSAAKRWLYLATRLMGLGLFSLVAFNLFCLALDLCQAGEVTPTLQIPQFPVAFLLAFCCIIQCLTLLAQMEPEGEVRP